MKGLLLDSDYVKKGERSLMRLFVKRGDETITALDPSFEPYLYAVAERPGRIAKAIGKLQVQKSGRTLKPKSVEVVERTLLGKKVESVKVTFHHQDDMHPLRHEIRGFPEVKDIYEFDIPPARRYLVDHELVPMSGVEIKGKVSEEDGRREVLLEKPPIPTKVSEPGLNIMSFDIEVYNPTGSPRH
ncbi:MAG: 3'-5' exonuclease, partial [Candidatus Hadarchaeota archaeon]|nr:3'-5' exonuclease [Candidatus Hadarchaeota archaeon]